MDTAIFDGNFFLSEFFGPESRFEKVKRFVFGVNWLKPRRICTAMNKIQIAITHPDNMQDLKHSFPFDPTIHTHLKVGNSRWVNLMEFFNDESL